MTDLRAILQRALQDLRARDSQPPSALASGSAAHAPDSAAWAELAEWVAQSARLVVRAETGAGTDGPDGADHAQDLLSKLLDPRVLARAAAHPHPQAFLFQALRNQVRDSFRRTEVRDRQAAVWALEQSNDPQEHGSLDSLPPSLSTSLEAALALLGETDRQIIEWLYRSPGKHRPALSDVAARLGITASYVATRHYRALRALRKILDELEPTFRQWRDRDDGYGV